MACAVQKAPTPSQAELRLPRHVQQPDPILHTCILDKHTCKDTHLSVTA